MYSMSVYLSCCLNVKILAIKRVKDFKFDMKVYRNCAQL